MTRNFKIIGGFGIAEKEIRQRKVQIPDIVDRYYQAGIREFFIGYNPPYWHDTFGFEFSPNGRFGENEQITSYDTFKQAVDYVHTLDHDGQPCEIFLAVNFWYYSDLTMPLLQRIISEALEIGVDGLIISSPEMMYYLASIGYTGKVNISTIMSLFNADAVGFMIEEFRNLGLNLNRVILPRELTPQEIKNICETYPDMQFEVFGHGDYCRYSNGLCMSEHKYFSRDLCGFVVKHGLDIHHAPRYDFKKIINDETLSDAEKQDMLNNSLHDIKDIFTSQNVFGTNAANTLINKYIQIFLNRQGDLADLAQQIYSIVARELKTNFMKYIYDGLNPADSTHNAFIDQFITLYNLILEYVDIDIDSDISDKINQIKTIKTKAQDYYANELKYKGKFGLETYYKFMLYNRTSVPLYRFFNDIPNIEVVKIPLRGRDLNIIKLGIDLIDDAIAHPEKYIDISNISGKYFHYDISTFDVFRDKLNQLSK